MCTCPWQWRLHDLPTSPCWSHQAHRWGWFCKCSASHTEVDQWSGEERWVSQEGGSLHHWNHRLVPIQNALKASEGVRLPKVCKNLLEISFKIQEVYVFVKLSTKYWIVWFSPLTWEIHTIHLYPIRFTSGTTLHIHYTIRLDSSKSLAWTICGKCVIVEKIRNNLFLWYWLDIPQQKVTIQRTCSVSWPLHQPNCHLQRNYTAYLRFRFKGVVRGVYLV